MGVAQQDDRGQHNREGIHIASKEPADPGRQNPLLKLICQRLRVISKARIAKWPMKFKQLLRNQGERR